MNKIERLSIPFGAQTLEIETGRIAKQAHGAVLASVGGTTLLVAVTHSPEKLEGRDFFPLMVDYREKFYAGGRIPGSFFRREARPGDDETLRARIVDRCIRPLFPDGMRHEVMVYFTVLSSDGENPAETATMTAASIALQISDIPFPVPMAGTQVVWLNDEYVVAPTWKQIEEAELLVTVAGTRDAINMVECSSNELDEKIVLGALKTAHEAIVRQLDAMKDFVDSNAKPKFDPQLPELPEDVKKKIDELARPKFAELVRSGLGKKDYGQREHDITKETAAEFAESHPDLLGQIRDHIDKVHGEEVRKLAVGEKKRVDGRGFDEIRPIECETNVLAKTHGSALFTRGQTQALGVATLGVPDEAQKIDNMLGITSKRFMLHYNFPPYSVGEARPMRAPGRREIGHGTLAEKALSRVIPSKEDFPYTLRVVSEILESNGSSSMATVCAGCLALMDAGVPIKKPVAGIAMGLIEYQGEVAVLTDIQGVEDHLGDMDFKVTGTRDGITALQMDIKIESVSFDVLEQALQQARAARLFILDKMAEALPAPRPELSPNAPRLTIIKIPMDKIGMIIGPGGKTIRAITEKTGATIDIEDDGTVFIASTDGASAEAARQEIENMTAEVEHGKTYEGKVVRITDFGAFVQLLPNQDGLVHISELEEGHVNRVEDVCEVGDMMRVKVINIDETGRVRLSRRAVLMEDRGEEYVAQPKSGGGGRGDDRGGRGGGRDRDRGGRGGDRGGRDRGGRGGPPRDRGGERRGPRGGGRDRDAERGPRDGGDPEVGGWGFRERERSKS